MVSISFSVKNNLAQGAREIEADANGLNRAMVEGVVRSEPILKDHIADIIQNIAGGVYWDIRSIGIIRNPSGASLRITTPSSKPHRIEPTKKHGLLVFEGEHSGASGTVFVRGGVNHPGSNPVDWVTRIAQGPGDSGSERIERAFTSEIEQVLR